ncbi:MAG: hypothetical protein LBB21_06860 [Holosporaceae bacterium]|jgi:hypothetical protein|nr:hypothetical protein [Holosporaceae bacterium]
MITKIESLLNKELAKVQDNEDICSDIFGSQKSKILEDRISSLDPTHKDWTMKHPGWHSKDIPWMDTVKPPRK